MSFVLLFCHSRSRNRVVGAWQCAGVTLIIALSLLILKAKVYVEEWRKIVHYVNAWPSCVPSCMRGLIKKTIRLDEWTVTKKLICVYIMGIHTHHNDSILLKHDSHPPFSNPKLARGVNQCCQLHIWKSIAWADAAIQLQSGKLNIYGRLVNIRMTTTCTFAPKSGHIDFFPFPSSPVALYLIR